MKIPKVAIIICTYNQDILLRKCLSSLKNKTNYKNYKIYFVDDSTKGKIGKGIKKDFPGVDVTINGKNTGFSKANNLGIKKALKEYAPDYVLLLNDDTEIIQENWVKEMVKVGESNEKIGILGCKTIYPNGSLQWFFKNNKIYFKKIDNYFKESNETLTIQEVKNVIGACFMIKVKLFNQIGFLDEKFSPVYGEETDFCYRATKKDFKLMYVGTTKIIHCGGSSTRTLFNEKRWYIKKRNSIRLEWLNFNFKKIIKYSFIHFGGVFFKKEDENISLEKNILNKFFLLCKGYLANILNLVEILQKRRERNR